MELWKIETERCLHGPTLVLCVLYLHCDCEQFRLFSLLARIRFPTLQLEETRTMLVELDVPEVDEPGDQEILFTSMSYFDIAQCRRIRAEALPISAMRTPLDPNVNDVTIQRSKEVTEADWRLAVSDVSRSRRVTTNMRSRRCLKLRLQGCARYRPILHKLSVFAHRLRQPSWVEKKMLFWVARPSSFNGMDMLIFAGKTTVPLSMKKAHNLKCHCWCLSFLDRTNRMKLCEFEHTWCIRKHEAMYPILDASKCKQRMYRGNEGAPQVLSSPVLLGVFQTLLGSTSGCSLLLRTKWHVQSLEHFALTGNTAAKAR